SCRCPAPQGLPPGVGASLAGVGRQTPPYWLRRTSAGEGMPSWWLLHGIVPWRFGAPDCRFRHQHHAGVYGVGLWHGCTAELLEALPALAPGFRVQFDDRAAGIELHSSEHLDPAAYPDHVAFYRRWCLPDVDTDA